MPPRSSSRTTRSRRNASTRWAAACFRWKEAAREIKVATEARVSRDFLIVARNDARTTDGLDEALRHANAFLDPGADILFIESPESEEEMETIAARFDVPLLATMFEGGRTPVLAAERLEALGYRIPIFPASDFLAAGAALRSVYRVLRTSSSASGYAGDLYDFGDFNRLMGFERVWTFERTHAEE